MEKTIVKMCFGSILYGTDTPESDTDIKGIFLPSKRDLLLGKIPKSISSNTKAINGAKNTRDDVDIEMYSLHYFIKMACEGQTVALDMLHAPDSMCIKTHPIWYELTSNKNKFYTKSMNAFVGYCKTQASKYGIKGSRLNTAKEVCNFFEDQHKKHGLIKLKDIWDLLPDGEHTRKYIDEASGLNMYEVCNRKMQETISVVYAYEIVKKFYDNYGERAKKAARNEGIDWKAVSHAIRVSYEMIELLKFGTITFPLKDREFVKEVKAGKLDYQTEVAPLLETLMELVEELSNISSYPNQVDIKFWEDFIIQAVEKYVL